MGDAQSALAKDIFNSFSDLLPILALLGLCIFFAWAAVRMQRAGMVNWQDGFVDTQKSVDLVRVGTFVSLIISSWVLCDLTLTFVKNQDDLDSLFKWYVLYLCVWSGAQAINRILEIVGVKYGVAPSRDVWTPEQRAAKASEAKAQTQS